MNSNSKLLPELDERAFGRNQKTAWLLYLDRLTAWLWQDNEGADRWTLIMDDSLRHASINHPPRTPAGLKNQVYPSVALEARTCTRIRTALPYHHLAAPEHRGA